MICFACNIALRFSTLYFRSKNVSSPRQWMERLYGKVELIHVIACHHFATLYHSINQINCIILCLWWLPHPLRHSIL